MAELHVQKKETSIWPWILAAVVILALLLWYFAGRDNDNDLDVGMNNMTDSTLVGTAPASGTEYTAAGTVDGVAVEQYMQFVNARASRSTGVAHEYTADGLRQLADALREVATAQAAGVDVEARIDEIRQRADAMQQNPTATEHALQAREAFVMAASLMGQMRSNTGANQDAVQEAAMAIEPSRNLLDQSEQIEQFFARAGDALRDLSASM